MKTFEDLSLEKLKEIEPATYNEFAKAMGYEKPNGFYHVFKKLQKANLIIQSNNKRPAKYTINKGRSKGK